MALVIFLEPYKQQHRASLNLVTSTRKGKWVLPPKGCRGRCICSYVHSTPTSNWFEFSEQDLFLGRGYSCTGG